MKIDMMILFKPITEEMGAPIWLSEKAQASTGIKNLHETS
jgi:hypothetical protein